MLTILPYLVLVAIQHGAEGQACLSVLYGSCLLFNSILFCTALPDDDVLTCCWYKQVQAYMLESLCLKLPGAASACITVPCLLDAVVPAFCRGASLSCLMHSPCKLLLSACSHDATLQPLDCGVALVQTMPLATIGSGSYACRDDATHNCWIMKLRFALMMARTTVGS